VAKKGGDGMPAGGFSKPTAITSTSSNRCARFSCAVIEYARAMGLDMIRAITRMHPASLSSLDVDDCLRTADRLTTYRQICAQVAREST